MATGIPTFNRYDPIFLTQCTPGPLLTLHRFSQFLRLPTYGGTLRLSHELLNPYSFLAQWVPQLRPLTPFDLSPPPSCENPSPSTPLFLRPPFILGSDVSRCILTFPFPSYWGLPVHCQSSNLSYSKSLRPFRVHTGTPFHLLCTGSSYSSYWTPRGPSPSREYA
jgi:hypothetical protein